MPFRRRPAGGFTVRSAGEPGGEWGCGMRGEPSARFVRRPVHAADRRCLPSRPRPAASRAPAGIHGLVAGQRIAGPCSASAPLRQRGRVSGSLRRSAAGRRSRHRQRRPDGRGLHRRPRSAGGAGGRRVRHCGVGTAPSIWIAGVRNPRTRFASTCAVSVALPRNDCPHGTGPPGWAVTAGRRR